MQFSSFQFNQRQIVQHSITCSRHIDRPIPGLIMIARDSAVTFERRKCRDGCSNLCAFLTLLFLHFFGNMKFGMQREESCLLLCFSEIFSDTTVRNVSMQLLDSKSRVYVKLQRHEKEEQQGNRFPALLVFPVSVTEFMCTQTQLQVWSQHWQRYSGHQVSESNANDLHDVQSSNTSCC